LDIREINGYSIQFSPFHPAATSTTITSPRVEVEEDVAWGGEFDDFLILALFPVPPLFVEKKNE
jgi:hypothetical protein